MSIGVGGLTYDERALSFTGFSWLSFEVLLPCGGRRLLPVGVGVCLDGDDACLAGVGIGVGVFKELFADTLPADTFSKTSLSKDQFTSDPIFSSIGVSFDTLSLGVFPSFDLLYPALDLSAATNESLS